MSSFKWKAGLVRALIVVAANGAYCSLAQSQTSSIAIDQPNRVSIAYVPPESLTLQELYDFLRAHQALERAQEILSPLRLPEELTIKTMECKAINAFYKRENFKPSMTICYELLKHILDSLPNETSTAGVTPPDAAVGQFLWVTLHEVGHATFDILKVPTFGHPEDAADNFATYVLLQFGQGAGAAVNRRRRLGLESVFRGLQEESRNANSAKCICE